MVLFQLLKYVTEWRMVILYIGVKLNWNHPFSEYINTLLTMDVYAGKLKSI